MKKLIIIVLALIFAVTLISSCTNSDARLDDVHIEAQARDYVQGGSYAQAEVSQNQGNEQIAPIPTPQALPEATAPPEPPEPYVPQISIDDLLLLYQNRNDEILVLVWRHVAQFASYFQSIYIPVPAGTDVAYENARDMMDRVIEDAVTAHVLGEILGDFGTGADVINALFNAGEQASAVMAAHVVESVLPFTTALNFIYQKGYVSEADLALAQDAFGNFMQRVGAVHGIGANAHVYLNAHNQMLDLYSEFHANIYLIGFIQSLPSGASPDSADVEAVSADIAYALGDIEAAHFVDNIRRISAIPLNFDETRAREIERTYGIGGAFLGALPFFGLFDYSEGVAASINRTSQLIFGILNEANDFATDTINPHIAQINILQQTIYQRASLLQALLDEPQYYAGIFAALSAMPQADREQVLSFDDLLEEFHIMAVIVRWSIDMAQDILGIVLSNAENDRLSQQLRNTSGAIFPHFVRNPERPESNLRQPYNMRPESQERMEAAFREIDLEGIWLKYDVVMDLRHRPWGANLSTNGRRLSHGSYYIEITRNQPLGPIVMIREFENTGTHFNSIHSPRWTTLFSERSGTPLIIIYHRTWDTVVFGPWAAMPPLYATDNWAVQLSGLHSGWDWPVFEALFELMYYRDNRTRGPDYVANLRRRQL